MNHSDASNQTVAKLCVSTKFLLRGIWVKPESLGHSFEWESGAYTVRLTLPEKPDDFVSSDEPETPMIRAWVPTARIEGSGEAVSVQIIKVEAEYEGPTSAAWKSEALRNEDDGEPEEAQAFRNQTERLWQEGFNAAEHSTHAWLNHVRTITGQSWLGIAAEKPYQYGRSHIFDTEAKTRLMSFGPIQSLTVRSGQLALGLDQLNLVRQNVAQQDEPQTSESLLADARFLAHEAEVIDTQRAVLIAAMACEIKTKAAIVNQSRTTNHDLTMLVLRRISNVPELLSKVYPALTGKSLKEDDPNLFKEIRELTEKRNQIVHSGEKVDPNRGWQLIVAARQLFDWLDEQ